MEDRYAHRKAAAAIFFIGQDGKPLSDRNIHISQKTHDFLFGCGAFDSLPATAPEGSGDIAFYGDATRGSAFYKDRIDKWLDVFNYGTIPFYWGGFEPREGHPLTESRMRAAAFLKENGVRVKGHPLCWHTVCADWLMDYDNGTILQKQIDRIHREVSTFKGVVDMWDVINEVCIMPVYDRYDNAMTRICRDLGRIRLVKEVFGAAKAANPEATLLINDFNLSESYRILIDGCLNAGVPISAIGIQTHQHQGYMGSEKLQDVLDRFSFFGLPLHFTENTLVSGEIMPKEITDLNDYQVESWKSTEEGEERQKNEWKEMYEMLFSHPLVEAVTGWDFADGMWLHAPSGFIREDGTPKPVYREVRHLVRDVWRTETVVHTDENGYAEVSGFKGTYEASCGHKTAAFGLHENAQLRLTLA